MDEVGAGVLVQIEVEGLAPVEALVGLGNRIFLVLNLVDLVKVLLELLARVLRAIPPRRFLDDRHDDLVLDHRVDVNRVVHAAEDAALVRVAHVEVVEQLQPERLQLVCIVLKQIEVVADGREDLVKVALKLTAILLDFELLGRAIVGSAHTLTGVLHGLEGLVATVGLGKIVFGGLLDD